MRMIPDRAVLTVRRCDGLWLVEFGDEQFGHSPEREVAMAAAHRRARQMQEAGRACQVTTVGERSWVGA
jgi:hypothetical protein